MIYVLWNWEQQTLLVQILKVILPKQGVLLEYETITLSGTHFTIWLALDLTQREPISITSNLFHYFISAWNTFLLGLQVLYNDVSRVLYEPIGPPTNLTLGICTSYDLFFVQHQLHLTFLDTRIVFSRLVPNVVGPPEVSCLLAAFFVKNEKISWFWLLRVLFGLHSISHMDEYLHISE